MHGVIVEVVIETAREEEARSLLREVVVPTAKALDGFVGGTWLRALDSDGGRGVLLFDSAEAASAAAEQIRAEGPPPGAPVKLQNVTAYEVLAQA